MTIDPSSPAAWTGAKLNALSNDERARVFAGGFGRTIHAWGASHVSYIHWANSDSTIGVEVHNASVFFLDCGGGLLGVTAAHVYEGYLRKKRASSDLVCRIANVDFDLEERLVGHRDGIDIATFKVSYEELAKIEKQACVVTHPGQWPAPPPFEKQSVYLGGFPGRSKIWTKPNELSFGLYGALTPITAITDRQLTCRFNRGSWVDTVGKGLPPLGFDLGGMSGGPVLALSDDNQGCWNWQVTGVISQAHSSEDFETVVAVRSDFIRPDGTINPF